MQLDGVAQCFQAVDQSTGDVLFVALIEIARSEIGVIHPVAQQVMGDDEDGVADGDDRLLLATSCNETVVLRAEVGVASATAGVRGFDEGGAQPGITLARLAALALA